MPVPVDKIADYARDDLPETWDALANRPGGADLLSRKNDSNMRLLFGSVLTADAQDALPELVAVYAGKKLALSIITPGIDYWSKQKISLGARTETGAYKDRAEDLRQLRKDLVQDLAELWPNVEPLVETAVTPRSTNAPRVVEPTTAHTSDPYAFEAAWAPPSEADQVVGG